MNMKYKTTLILFALLATIPVAGHAQDKLKSHPAYLPLDTVLDMAVARPEVNVNLPRFLLQNVVSELNGGPDDSFASMGIDFKDLVKGIELIRVVVIESNEENKHHITKGVEALRKQLESKWTPIVSVPEDGVGVYGMSDASGDAMIGIAVLVNDDGDVVIGNLVGDVSIGKMLKIATQMKSFPSNIMEKLAGLGGGTKQSTPAPQDEPATEAAKE